jgi:hypothetical protein|tara:strand:- start:966 stop:1163 length:198 start_codon:yes stop_codon:yes gene_type:complete
MNKKTWTTEELREEFEVIGFLAPYVAVKRKSDNIKGSLLFEHHPRIYYDFVEDKPYLPISRLKFK